MVGLAVICVLSLAPIAAAQAGESVPVIRTEASEVLVPAAVFADVRGGDYDVLHLSTQDFRLFEDGKEQRINNVTLERIYWTPAFPDNLGFEANEAFTPKGKWVHLRNSPFPFLRWSERRYYLIAYPPPSSPADSCHKIKITVNAKDSAGRRLTRAEIEPIMTKSGPYTLKAEVDRRNLLINSRAQYCNTPHSATDPLYGTPMSKKMEDIAFAPKNHDNRVNLSAVDFYDESHIAHVHATLDFPSISDRTGVPSFVIALLGMAYQRNGVLKARFSDSEQEGCAFLRNDSDWLYKQLCDQDTFPNHYETEVQLPPGEYNLRVVLDFGGDIRRADAPVTVREIGKQLVVSGIALCSRFHPYKVAQTPPESSDQQNVPIMPFELQPLVSKGIEFTPTGETRFKKKEPLIAYFELYEPLLTEGRDTHVQFQVKISDAQTGEIKSDTGPRPADPYINPGRGTIPISQQIAIGELPSGTYRLDIQAFDSAGGHAESSSTLFTVE